MPITQELHDDLEAITKHKIFQDNEKPSAEIKRSKKDKSISGWGSGEP